MMVGAQYDHAVDWVRVGVAERDPWCRSSWRVRQATARLRYALGKRANLEVQVERATDSMPSCIGRIN
jgi:hypothetical protein